MNIFYVFIIILILFILVAIIIKIKSKVKITIDEKIGKYEENEIIIDPRYHKKIIAHVIDNDINIDSLFDKYKNIDFINLNAINQRDINIILQNSTNPVICIGKTNMKIPGYRYYLTDDIDKIINNRNQNKQNKNKQNKNKNIKVDDVIQWLVDIKNNDKQYKKDFYIPMRIDEFFNHIDYQIQLVTKFNNLNWKPMIIHVSGPSGSGKTTLMNNLKCDNCLVYDTDDLINELMTKLYKSNEYKNFILNDNVHEFKMKLNSKILKLIFTILNTASKSHKNIIFIGMTIDVYSLAEYKYIINLDPKENYIRRNIRELNTLCNNKTKIEKLLKNNDPIEFSYEIAHNIQHGTKIISRYGEEIKKINMMRAEHQQYGYILLPADQIINEINILLSN
jgi:adenylylsulfate kinase-like enzyme